MGDSSWQSNVYNAEGALAISNVRVPLSQGNKVEGSASGGTSHRASAKYPSGSEENKFRINLGGMGTCRTEESKRNISCETQKNQS
ncbi:hypothetical protein V6N12_026595 [Hibiscus sabdariffa]|uniref:Uncharacterized protein n=1 Tax=Hibiscus sabdariffa TaxID=183260 RepID=A0ABR2DS85_9ROSI